MDYSIKEFKKFTDDRGDLVVFLQSSDLSKERKMFGQIYFVTFAKKGVIRGNHYHKKWREWFGIVSGVLEVTLKDVKTNEVKNLVLNADSSGYIRLEIGPYIAHAFKSVSDNAALLNYTDTEWSPDDTISEKLV